MPEWTDCRDALPPVPAHLEEAKRYRVKIGNRIDMFQLGMKEEGEAVATFDDLGFCVERQGSLIDVRPSHWKEERA